jgi:hypothetical protein
VDSEQWIVNSEQRGKVKVNVMKSNSYGLLVIGDRKYMGNLQRKKPLKMPI